MGNSNTASLALLLALIACLCKEGKRGGKRGEGEGRIQNLLEVGQASKEPFASTFISLMVLVCPSAHSTWALGSTINSLLIPRACTCPAFSRLSCSLIRTSIYYKSCPFPLASQLYWSQSLNNIPCNYQRWGIWQSSCTVR